MIRRPPRSTQSRSSAASDVYKRQQQESAWGRTPVRRCPVCYRGTPARGVSCMVCHSEFYMRGEEPEEWEKPTRSDRSTAATASARSTTRGSTTSVEQGVEEESQGAPTKWIEPVRREDEAIPDYGVFKAAGTMRSVNDIKFFSWKQNRQWVLGTDYQKNRPPHRSNQPEEMPSAFMQFLKNLSLIHI